MGRGLSFRLIPLFVSIIMILPLTGRAEGPTKYVSKDFGFSISLPDGWTYKEFITNRRIEFYAPYPSGKEKGNVNINYLKEWDTPLEKVAITHSTNIRNLLMRKMAVKIIVEKQFKTPLASGQFAAFIFEKWQATKYRNVSGRRIHAYTKLGKKLFVITMERKPKYFKKMQPDFQLIINSFAAAKP